MSKCKTCSYGERPEYDEFFDIVNFMMKVKNNAKIVNFGRRLNVKQILEDEEYNNFGKQLLMLGRMQFLYMDSEMFCKNCFNQAKKIIAKHYCVIKEDDDLELVYTELLNDRLKRSIKINGVLK